jgi:ParB-like chromosome segregation protein Spo0J
MESKIAIVYRPLAEIRHYQNNPRTHTPGQIAKLKKSLAKYGWTNPLLIADGELLAGHARTDAAIEMAGEGMPIRGNPDPYMAPTVDLSHLSKAERRAYIIADNQLQITGSGWDNDLLRGELTALSELDFDLSLTGFEDSELSGLLAEPPGDGLTDQDEVPATPQTPVSRPGRRLDHGAPQTDVWRQHKLYRRCCAYMWPSSRPVFYVPAVSLPTRLREGHWRLGRFDARRVLSPSGQRGRSAPC